MRLTWDWGHHGGSKLVPCPRPPGVGWGHPGPLLMGSLLLDQATVNATVEMGTKIEEKFNDNLKDQSSEEYQKFVKRFQNQVRTQRCQG